MFSHKTMARIAVVMVIVFGLIIIVYPRIFSPSAANPAAVPVAPAIPAPPAAQ
jgi:hypothetical protein